MTMNNTVVDRFWMMLGASFGWDALERKYGATVPDEWRDALLALDERQFARGVERLKKSGSQFLPTLPEFLSMARKITEEDRISPAFQLEAPARGTDKWDAAASRHLFAHLLRKYRMFPSEAAHTYGLVRTAIFVTWKNKWARIMREMPPDQIVEAGKAQWQDCMRQAEQEIARRPDANPEPAKATAGGNWWDEQ
jgi:hypothetical protein